MVTDALPGISNAHDQLLGNEGLQDGFIAGSLRGMPIQRTNSSSSFGSEGAPYATSAGGMNDYHRGYQGSFFKIIFDPTPLHVMSALLNSFS